MNLLQMSAAGGILIVVTVLLRAVLLHRLPKKTFLILWGIALCRLLVPYTLQSAVSVYTLLPKAFPAAKVTEKFLTAEDPPAGQAVAPQTTGTPAAAPQTVAPQAVGLQADDPQAVDLRTTGTQTDAPQAVDAQADLPQAAAIPILSAKAPVRFPVRTILWLFGALLCSAFFTASYIRSRRKFAQSLPVEQERLQDWYALHRLKRKLAVRQSDQIAAPLTYGMFRPVILMPKATDWEETDQLCYILEHEYVHIQRCDAAVKLVIVLAVCIHWFNPLVWIMYVLFNRDIELACDETVLRRFGETRRSAYARLLIGMEERAGGLVPFVSSFSKTAIEERIMAIMKTKKRSFVMTAAAAAVILSITAVFATSAETDDGGEVSGISDTEISEEDYQELLALKYDGYESMSIREYRERVWKDTDSEAWSRLLERASEDTVLYELRNDNDLAGFLFYTLLPLMDEEQQSHAFSGSAVMTDYPYISDQAVFEYTAVFTILDAGELTVGEYMDARAGLSRELGGILEGKTAQELQDETAMEAYVQKQAHETARRYEKDGLQIVVEDWIYVPLVNTEAEDAAAYEKEYAEEWERVLAPYLPLGLTLSYDTDMQEYRMYYQGKEAKSIYDEKKDLWISGHQGVGSYDADAVELYAVYENGELAGLREANEQEAAQMEEQRRTVTREWASDEYQSLLELKTADYQKMELRAFNSRLLDWANEDYERMKRIDADAANEEWRVSLTEEEKQFVLLTVGASGQENAEEIQSDYTGWLPEDPTFGGSLPDKTEETDKGMAWCSLYYEFSWHIPDKSRITVGERDRCVGGMLTSIQNFWQETSLEECLQMEKSDVVAALQSFAEEYSSEQISIGIDEQRIGFEKMDERGIN